MSNVVRDLFRDSLVQDHFGRYGWVKVDLLNQEEVSRLNDGFAMLCHHFSEGFDTTAIMADPKIKSLAKELIRPIFIEKTKKIFVDCDIFAESFVSKGCAKDSPHFIKTGASLKKIKDLPQQQYGLRWWMYHPATEP